MANGKADLRWRLGTSGHPKIVRLVQACGERAFRALSGLWEWTAANRPNGDLKGMDALDVAIAAGWPDATPAFTEALQAVRLLDGKPGKWRVHDWQEEQPYVAGAEARSEAARILSRKRWDLARNAGRNAERIRGASDPDAGRNPPSPDPSPLPLPSPSPSPDPSPPRKPPDVPRGTLPGSNPPGLAAVPDSGGALPAKIAAERKREAGARDAFETELARWTAAGNRGGERAFRELRTACLREGAPFDPDRLYPVPWTPASLRGVPTHA